MRNEGGYNTIEHIQLLASGIDCGLDCSITVVMDLTSCSGTIGNYLGWERGERERVARRENLGEDYRRRWGNHWLLSCVLASIGGVFGHETNAVSSWRHSAEEHMTPGLPILFKTTVKT